MTELKIRKLPFAFDGVDFLWNPANPGFSVLMNQVSFFAIGFERYICRVIADAEPLIRDAAVLAEARAFRVQESLHSQVHRRHVKALISRYPGLQGALDDSIASFDALYEAESLEFHLGYIGGLESIFTPLFRMMLDHRDLLFEDGDARVASMFIWHFFEEIEHRSSGLIIYDAVVGRYLYRIRNYRRYMQHAKALFDQLSIRFRAAVPGLPPEAFTTRGQGAIPLRSRLRSVAGVLAAQLPWHNPTHETLPEYYAEWAARYESGEDMTQTCGRPVAHVSQAA